MPVTFEPAEEEVDAIVADLIEDHFPDLAEAEVTVNALFASSENGDPVKHDGYPAHATIKVNNYKDRVEGKRDCTITIDKHRWENKTEIQRQALIDHKLRHLVVKRITKGEDEGEIKLDALGRPMLGCCKHDFVLGGFDEIARRYGDDAPEVQGMQSILRKYQDIVR